MTFLDRQGIAKSGLTLSNSLNARYCSQHELKRASLWQTPFLPSITMQPIHWFSFWEKMGAQWLSGRVLDSRPKGRGFEPHRRHCVVSLSKNINPSLVLVQPRKTCPYITERLLMGRKESNQIKKSFWENRNLLSIAEPHSDFNHCQ